MAKRTKPEYQLSEKELEAHHASSLSNIRQLCNVFDGGHTDIATTLASEINRLLTANPFAIRRRATVQFPTPDRDVSPGNLLPVHKLWVLKLSIEREGGSADCAPNFESESPKIKWLKFFEWWEKDIIYRGGTPFQGIQGWRPVDEALTRKEFIEDVRKKLGAHLDVNQPEQLKRLMNDYSFPFELAVVNAGIAMRRSDGTLPFKRRPFVSMIRQIAEEVLMAFNK